MINWKTFYDKIPSSIKVGKNTYEILWCNGFARGFKYGESRFGDFKQIVINKNQSKKEAVHTYWHELLHIFSEEYEANLTENQVKSLEKGLYFLLKHGNMWKERTLNVTTNKRRRKNSRRISRTR